MLMPWHTGIITRIEEETPTTRRFWIKIEAIQNFAFEPGQFITLDLPIHEQKNKRWRSYSIASAPNGTNEIELIIVLLEGGAGTNYLFNEAKVGTSFQVRGPQGKFVLPETIEKDLYLICTGTGIAPFRSMVQHLKNTQKTFRQIHLIFGCRYFTDALYKQELIELQEKLPGFFYHPTYSREEYVDVGEYKGYVHKVYESLLNYNKKPAQFYLCGWKNMIDEAKEKIITLGYDKHDIHLELYG